MSEAYFQQQQPTLTWNTARGVWEKAGMANLLCEHWELFSETWQTSGWMRNGQVFELRMPEHHTTDSESLSSHTLRTPMASDSQGSAKSSVPGKVWNLVGQVRNEFSDELLRTPAASEAERGHQPEDKSRARGGQVTLSGQMMTYFPTPNTMDHLPARTPEQKLANKGKGGYANVRETVVNDLMGTPQARDYKGRPGRQEDKNLNHDVARQDLLTNWGKFEPAIKRWEETLGRPAPAPTKPDGKEGGHRLSSAFTEWMMGVPEGWITDCGLSRNDELKACGNGVVPQQAELALRMLLDTHEIE
jgi:hypothetical protein